MAAPAEPFLEPMLVCLDRSAGCWRRAIAQWRERRVQGLGTWMSPCASSV